MTGRCTICGKEAVGGAFVKGQFVESCAKHFKSLGNTIVRGAKK